MWDEPYSKGLMNGLREYCTEYPEQFELVDTFLTEFKFSWEIEVEALSRCDYVLPPLPPHIFIKEFRDNGANTNYIGTVYHSSFMETIIESGVVAELNNMLIIHSFPWWTDTGDFITLAQQVFDNSPKWYEDSLVQPSYLSVIHDLYIVFGAIEYTISVYGTQGFNSHTLYESLQMFSFNVDGCSHSFSQTKRTSNETLGIYRLDADNQTLIRADSEWIPIVTEP